MSEEQPTPPPALRLKPRLRPADASPPPPAVPPPSAVTPPPSPFVSEEPPAAAEPEGGKFKLKPRGARPPFPMPADEGPAAPTSLAPLAPAAASSQPPLPPAPLFMREPSPPPTAGPSMTIGEIPRTPPPFPLVAPADAGRTNSPIPHLKMTARVVETDDGPVIAPRRRGAGGGFKRVASLLLLLVAAGGGYFAWQKYSARPASPVASPPAPAPAVPGTKAPAAGAPAKPAATPLESLNTLAHAPINAINKAQDAIAARRNSEQSRVDAMSAGEDASAKKRALATPPPSTFTPKPAAAPTYTTIAPGISASTEIESAGGAAGLEFRTFVANAKISGVFQGTPSRAFINGRMTRVGDTVDGPLGIVFESVDPEKKAIVFKDKSGATVTRRY